MGNKSVDDYLTEGIHGSRLPKQAERDYFLGTLRERIILALKIGEVMRDKGLKELNQAMEEYPDGTLIFNGQVASKFQVEEKKLAKKHDINYTMITNNENTTDIGAVYAMDEAIEKESIFLKNQKEAGKKENNANKKKTETPSFFTRIKRWLS